MRFNHGQSFMFPKAVGFAKRAWNIESIFFAGNPDNPRVRIGRTDEQGQYHWELVFMTDLENLIVLHSGFTTL